MNGATASLGGVVSADGLPLPGAVVELGWDLRLHATSGPDGHYGFEEVPAGELPLLVRHPDYWPHRRVVDLDSGANTLDLAFERVRVTGTVVDGGSGGAVIKPTLRVTDQIGSSYLRVFRGDQNGDFDFDLPLGTYNVVVLSEGYAEKREVLAATSDLDGLVIYLEAESSVEGRVILETGSAVELSLIHI